MLKENKDFFLYILAIIVLIFVTLFVIDYLLPGTASRGACGFLGYKCWFKKGYEEKTYSEYPKMIIEQGKDYKATIRTNYGDFEIDLYEENTPLAVNSFVFLAQDDYYDNVKFHRVIKDLLIQTGDRNTLDSNLKNDGEGSPGYIFQDEINWDSLNFSKAKRQQLEEQGYSSNQDVVSKHLGYRSVALANGGPNTNGSQFFIVTGSSGNMIVESLEGRHTVFGKISFGWDVIEKIGGVAVDDPSSNSPKPKEDIIILDIEIFTDS
ncbi:MAG: peptidylprolyl isomerase [Patescibacteria group bacterium]|nr:peptidylprolyl isomerase [Patescibacteria group bacterium]